MRYNWQCPHAEEILDIIDDTNDIISEELNSERQRIINILSNRINQLADELPKQRERRNIKSRKNDSFRKLARNNIRGSSKEIDNTLIHEVKLFDGITILLCDDCYRTMQRDIVIEILTDFRSK